MLTQPTVCNSVILKRHFLSIFNTRNQKYRMPEEIEMMICFTLKHCRNTREYFL